MDESRFMKRLVGAAAAVLVAAPAVADITVGATLPLTGPGAALGLPLRDAFQLWPAQIAGEKVNLIILDDAGDPTQATKNAQKLASEDKVDVLTGSAITPAALAVVRVAQETQTLQFAFSPVELPPDAKWTFVIPQRVSLMAEALIADMKARRIKTVGFIGFNDVWGETWFKELSRGFDGTDIKFAASERYGRADTSVTAQVLKLMAANPDAVMIAASGTGAAVPQIALKDRGYKGLIYQSHGAGSRDFLRIAGKSAEGVILPIGPVLVPGELPNAHPSKRPVEEFVAAFEGRFGKGAPVVFGAHVYDVLQILQRAVPAALKVARPGTLEFRRALRDSVEAQHEIAGTNGVFNFTPADHYGLDSRGREMVNVVGGEWKIIR
jgi:branched-chain amino acid transport system substrate-binding protein